VIGEEFFLWSRFFLLLVLRKHLDNTKFPGGGNKKNRSLLQVALDKVFSENKIDTVIHCAGLKAVGESVREPVAYYENNFVGSVNLIKAMSGIQCSKEKKYK
jgi:nucleoside-diphosphate-sugar epimerase